MPVADDDGRDLHAASTLMYTATVRRAVSAQLNACARSSPAATRRSRSHERLPHAVCQPLGLDEDRRVTGHLAQRGIRRGDDGRPGGHRLQHGQAESLVPRRHQEAGGAAVELDELLLRHVAPELGAAPLELPGKLGVAHGAGNDEREPDLGGSSGRRQRVLAFLDRSHQQQVVAAVAVAGRERGIGAVWRDGDPLRRDAVQLDDVALRPL